MFLDEALNALKSFNIINPSFPGYKRQCGICVKKKKEKNVTSRNQLQKIWGAGYTWHLNNIEQHQYYLEMGTWVDICRKVLITISLKSSLSESDLYKHYYKMNCWKSLKFQLKKSEEQKQHRYTWPLTFLVWYRNVNPKSGTVKLVLPLNLLCDIIE